MELGCYVLWETQRLPRRAWAASYSSENARAGKRGDFGLPPLLVEPQGHVAVVLWGLLGFGQWWVWTAFGSL